MLATLSVLRRDRTAKLSTQHIKSADSWPPPVAVHLVVGGALQFAFVMGCRFLLLDLDQFAVWTGM